MAASERGFNTALGGNRLLGCRTTTVPVALTLSGLRATRSGIAVNVTCEFPAGTECPGPLGLRVGARRAPEGDPGPGDARAGDERVDRCAVVARRGIGARRRDAHGGRGGRLRSR